MDNISTSLESVDTLQTEDSSIPVASADSQNSTEVEIVTSSAVYHVIPPIIHQSTDSSGPIDVTQPKKRPSYSMDKEDTPQIKNARKTDQPIEEITEIKTKKVECQKCKHTVGMKYQLDHVLTHTDIKRFECVVNGCGSKFTRSEHVNRHIKKQHPTQPYPLFRSELNCEQKKEVMKLMKECFDEEYNSDDICQLCLEKFDESRGNTYRLQLGHSLTHLDFMLNKCSVDGCLFEGKKESDMKCHWGRNHKYKIGLMFLEIELTEEQKLKKEEMLKRCFPNIADSQNSTDVEVFPSSTIFHVIPPIIDQSTDSSDPIVVTQPKKRPRCSMDKEDTPQIKNARKTDQPIEEITDNKTIKCRKCATAIKTAYSNQLEHVMTHTDIKRFECLVDRCGLKFNQRGNILRHIKAKHPNQLKSFLKTDLNPQEIEKIDAMMKECFDLENKQFDNCQLCHQKINRNDTNSYDNHREHSHNHLDFMIYKCMREGCQFESKTAKSMKSHWRVAHEKGAAAEFSKIDLTEEHNWTREIMLIKCFPNIDTLRTEDSSIPVPSAVIDNIQNSI